VKPPVSGPRWLGETGLQGDAQADLDNHGGPEKAVCVYPLEHYPYWTERLGKSLEPGSFGENFSTQGLSETEVCIGDVYRVGSSLLQVSQPRQPCYKLAARHGVPEMAAWVQEQGRTGFYLRCLEPGEVRAGDEVSLVERPAGAVSVTGANRVMHHDRHDREGIRALLAMGELLAGSWRTKLEKRLAGAEEDPTLRLEGPASGGS
jgi:MOSC domain-containing protein YiiM